MSDTPSLDAYFGPKRAEAPLGMVVGGSLSAGLLVNLNPQLSIERLAVGRYVVVEGASGSRFFGLVTDIGLDAINPDLVRQPPPAGDAFAAEVYSGGLAFGALKVTPMLVLDPGEAEARPVKTVPAHFTAVYEAAAEDVEQVFGREDKEHFFLGTPLDMEQVRIHLDLPRLVQRSSGVFGKSGTGKSFITRTLLAGVIRSRLASVLIFDMHNDYGWTVRGEAEHEFKGLRQLFTDGSVNVVTLDPQTSAARDSRVDRVLQIGYDQIEPEDVEMLAGLLDLSDVQVGALYWLRRRLGRTWIAKLLAEEKDPELEKMLEDESIVKGTLHAIQRKFELFRRLEFLVPGDPGDVVDDIFQRLNRKTSVVLEFGRYGNLLEAYVLVANFLTRRIHQRYVSQMDKAVGRKADEPHPLTIVIEEAHKFLDPAIAGHTIFGTIARELRKYNVTLLIVDQRPSGIDEEVMSQIGTRITCLLDNEADVRAVLSGVSGAATLREVLARLDTRQQALILGHAVPMPVVIRVRDYDTGLYADLGAPADEGEVRRRGAKAARDLYGD
ncbi:MAG TPA: ATP-binding protein [Anaerolineales bacterium]|nr:ATP-binding protein [Anaerolineales bacterium]